MYQGFDVSLNYISILYHESRECRKIKGQEVVEANSATSSIFVAFGLTYRYKSL